MSKQDVPELCTYLEWSFPRCGPTIADSENSLASEMGRHSGAKMATGWWNVLAGNNSGLLAPSLWVSSPGYCLLLTMKLHVFGNLVTSGVSILIRLLLAFPFLAWSCCWVFFSNLLYIGNSIEKPLHWSLRKTQLEIPRLAHMSEGLMCIHTKQDPPETTRVWG